MRLGDYTDGGWLFIATCDTCGRQARVDPAEVLTHPRIHPRTHPRVRVAELAIRRERDERDDDEGEDHRIEPAPRPRVGLLDHAFEVHRAILYVPMTHLTDALDVCKI